jgi:hypothetical protein
MANVQQDLPGNVEPVSASPKPAGGEGVDYGAANTLDNRRGPLVALILVLLVVSTVVMVGFIWYRWNGVREPTTAIIVAGDASLVGTEITVSGGRTITATIDSGNNYRVPILVDPGEYVVSAMLHGQTLFRTTVEVKRFLGVEFDLPAIVKDAVARGTLVLDTQPSVATQPAR